MSPGEMAVGGPVAVVDERAAAICEEVTAGSRCRGREIWYLERGGGDDDGGNGGGDVVDAVALPFPPGCSTIEESIAVIGGARLMIVADIGGFLRYHRCLSSISIMSSLSALSPSTNAYSKSFGGGPSFTPLRLLPVAPPVGPPPPSAACHANTISLTSSSSSSSGQPNHARHPPAPAPLKPAAAEGGSSPRAIARWMIDRERRRTMIARKATETEVTSKRTRTERN